MSDRPAAVRKAGKMREVLLDFGVPQVRIELLPGRPSSFGVWDSGFFVADMSHHTVSRYGSNLTPCLFLVKNGRSDLPGPLANGYGGWDLCYRIITFGYANHPGEGGPYTVPALSAGRFTIPQDSARRYAWGTEWEGGLSSADWDRKLTNPATKKQMTMREFMGRSNAGLQEALEIHEGGHMEHSTWTSRKIDRLGYDRARGIAEKRPFRNADEPDLPVLHLDNVRRQFRIHKGLQGGKLQDLEGVRLLQNALKDRYDVKLKSDGIVDDRTIEAWKKHEARVGVDGRASIPDAATVGVLSKNRFIVKR